MSLNYGKESHTLRRWRILQQMSVVMLEYQKKASTQKILSEKALLNMRRNAMLLYVSRTTAT